MSIFHIIFSLLCNVPAATPQNSFINPPGYGAADDYTGNLAWPLYSIQVIKWTSNFSSNSLLIYQNNGDGSGDPATLAHASSSGSSSSDPVIITYRWNVTTALNFVTNPAFWLQVDDGEGNRLHSHYFNITSPISTTTSSALFQKPLTSPLGPYTSLSNSSASSISSPTSFATASTPTQTTKPTSSPSLSIGAEVSISIIIPVFTIVAATAGFLFWRRSDRSKIPSQAPIKSQGPGISTNPYSDPVQSLYPAMIARHELPGMEAQRFELEGSRELPTNELSSEVFRGC